MVRHKFYPQVAMLTKSQIRSKILLRLKTQKEADRERKSRLIKNKLFKIKEFVKAKTVMFYVSFDGEVNTQDMIEGARRSGKIIAVPVIGRDRQFLSACLLGCGAELKKGPYGVDEPAVKRPVKLEDLDLVVVPGIAFDKKGNRLGRGRGCYDRLLSKLKPDTVSVGLAFDFQILPSLPAGPRDLGVDRLLSA